jgi:hypothetical protein
MLSLGSISRLNMVPSSRTSNLGRRCVCVTVTVCSDRSSKRFSCAQSTLDRMTVGHAPGC